MDKAIVWVEEVFRFNCPECGHFEEMDDDPDGEVISCGACGEELELEVVR